MKERYGLLFEAVTGILFRHDPEGINFEFNTDEYEPEAETILPRLKDCSSPEDVCRVVVEEFVYWFGPGEGKDETTFIAISQEIWEVWHKESI
ncbi:MAG: hypothetical protein K1Y36_11365 [Blastocatellia bacterium]|nr:hypothetical protein [Blastocatellia bacterium]